MVALHRIMVQFQSIKIFGKYVDFKVQALQIKGLTNIKVTGGFVKFVEPFSEDLILTFFKRLAWINNTPLATVTKTRKHLLHLLKFSIDSALQQWF